VRAAVLVALVFVLAIAAGCGSDDGDQTSSANGCESVEQPEPRASESLEPPTEPLDTAKTYALTFETNCGSFTVALDQELAPNAAASLVSLADSGYFDDTIFHRVVPGFVIQGGDPTQSGAGGPGYSTVDVPPADANYPKGTVAMAKSEVEPAGTAGSQFFVVTVDDAPLTPDYAIAGTVTDGMDTVARIEALGVGDGPPTQPVVVSTVTVT
jgi:peptidyl-prolyl cis-trans isomerase B (cyclophilin B)